MNRETDLAVVERDASEFVSNLTKSTGTGIGLELRESELIINVKNYKVEKARMVFNVPDTRFTLVDANAVKSQILFI
ncbi:hypothetical protein T459_28739 [Capsicum annuum]|uniref:FACT complex subunit n=1 Tax=Capsicum annuum TaxID=4072 RepID=A0A2G2YHL8_CAPAN|nr:hypothetical protein T459_28739 [Capsicum annuum]